MSSDNGPSRPSKDPFAQARACQQEGWEQFGLHIWLFEDALPTDNLVIRTILYLPGLPDSADYLRHLWKNGRVDCPDIEGARVEYYQAQKGHWVKLDK